MKNHVFLIQAHAQPMLVKRLVERLVAPNHWVLVHIDRKSDIKPFMEVLSNHKQVLFMKKRIFVNHGGFSQIECTINMLKELKRLPIAYDYVHLISGQDYPIVSNEQFDAYFENSSSSYMHFDTDEQHQVWKNNKYPERYMNYYYNDMDATYARSRQHIVMRARRVVVKKVHHLVMRFWGRRRIQDVRAGWNWFSWNKDVVEYVLHYLSHHRSFYRRFKYTSCCDEIIFHTILYPVKDQLDLVVDNALRYIVWESNGVWLTSPKILDGHDYNSIIESKKLFCRKIDAVLSKQLLNRLDDAIVNYQ